MNVTVTTGLFIVLIWCLCVLSSALTAAHTTLWFNTLSYDYPTCYCDSIPRNAWTKNQSILPFSLTNLPHRDQIVVHIRQPDNTPLNSHRRLIWCPFILDDNDENQDDTSQTLALLHEDRVPVFYRNLPDQFQSLVKLKFKLVKEWSVMLSCYLLASGRQSTKYPTKYFPICQLTSTSIECCQNRENVGSYKVESLNVSQSHVCST